MQKKSRFSYYILSLLLCAGLSACGATKDLKTPEARKTSAEARVDSGGKLFGEDVVIFGGDPKKQVGANSGIGVNGFLWRAALDTVSFMPLQSADPFGGVINTDWYTPSETPNKRYKLTVYILDTQLRASGIKVAMFRETIAKNGAWVSEDVHVEDIRKIEDSILTRARQLKLVAEQ